MQAVLKEEAFANGVPHLPAIATAIELLIQHATMHTASHASFFRSKWNARKKITDVSGLKASIRAQGLLQNLVGYKEVVDGVQTGRVGIAAGDRRWTSIGQLIEEGDFPIDYQIPYLLVSEDEAIEISLAENLDRADMHPADVYEAMLELTHRGRSIEDIALKFNLDTTTVKKRLKLANVAPRLLDLYRNDEANFEQMMALAISDDHAAQEQAWDSLGKYNRSAHEIRRLLTAQQVNIRTDKVARYVGVEAFEKAGGIITRDLFSTNGDGYANDVALLERLALDKLEKQRAKLLKEGFGWVEVMLRADHSSLSAYIPVRTSLSPLTPEQQARADELDEQIAKLDRDIDAADEDDEAECERLYAEQDQLNEERETLQRSRTKVPNDEDKALAGAVVTLDQNGSLLVKRDVIRPTDKAKMVKLATEVESPAAARRAKPVHSDRLTHELTSQRTVALQAEMMDQGEIALVYLTYTLMCKVLATCSNGTLAKISTSRAMLADVAKKSPAAEAFRQRREQLMARLPDDDVGGGWLEWLTRQPTAVVMEVMAFCVASTLDATQQRESDSPQFVTLALGLQLDMTKWWKASAADYFNHVSKDRMVAVVTEAVSSEAAVPLEKMKKAAAAEAAERAVAEAGWLPPALRSK